VLDMTMSGWYGALKVRDPCACMIVCGYSFRYSIDKKCRIDASVEGLGSVTSLKFAC
jgi:hypothetical protein